MTTETDFRISVGDDSEHEDLTAEIYFRDRFVAIVSQESGLEAADIELHACPTGEPWTFKFADFLDALGRAKQRLWELRRVPRVE
ncbi:MAG: hypothetical protein JNM30_20510 [Rhodospirillales bacterium]|nr:hypothetical protein [Rhodospirillales bacterium]